ncbi:MAG: T9SS type A sorting domain-containing protein [Saprospiraceae bacterium]|nr:T9SS type A sorting domain-containing protein [Saprospiraceae bacterium]
MSIRALLFVLLPCVLQGQSFEPTNGPLLQQEVAFEQANECYIIFNNLSGDSLTLRWRLLEVSMPDGWDADLCDYGLCYSGIPGNGIMNPVVGPTQPYLKLIVLPDVVPGAAWLWFRAWEDGNEDNFVDVYFSLHTPGTSAAGTAGEAAPRFYPNPATDLLTLENPAATAAFFQLIAPSGQLVLQQQVLPNSAEQVSLRHLRAGTYFLKTGQKTTPLLITNE